MVSIFDEALASVKLRERLSLANNGVNMQIENVSLREVQEVWETNHRYSAASRAPEMVALIDALAKMNVGDAKAIGYTRGRNPANVKLQVQKAAKVVGKNVHAVIDEDNLRVMFSVLDKPMRRRRRTNS